MIEERKLQCPNCSKPMQLSRIAPSRERSAFAHYECKPCGVNFSETIENKDPGDRTLQ